MIKKETKELKELLEERGFRVSYEGYIDYMYDNNYDKIFKRRSLACTQDWLRKKKHVDVWVFPNKFINDHSKIEYAVRVNINHKDNDFEGFEYDGFEDYYDALEKGLFTAIEYIQ